METSTEKYIRQFDEFLDNLEKRYSAMPKKEARKEALEGLKRTGVVGKNGKVKKNIVSWGE